MKIYDKMRNELPYGFWTLADGSVVLFNRNYKPIWIKRVQSNSEPIIEPYQNRNDWIKWVTQQNLYDDSTSPMRSRKTRELLIIFMRNNFGVEMNL
jgi:hypothetical protein